MMPLGTKAPNFNLTDVRTSKQIKFAEARGAKGTVIMFICVHCPYVIHVQDQIADIADHYEDLGISFIAISANEIMNYPQDAPAFMKAQAEEVGFNFPYLFDQDQSVAKAYGAECTPDFFVFDENDSCVYRGRMDASTPGNEMPNDGEDLRGALEDLVEGKPLSENQKPSMGCNIKWK
ncbi:MAG: peroxiredoxin [Marinoscillum sp.]|jgi:peroxiredoxin